MSLGFIINPNFFPLTISPPQINKYTLIVTQTHKDRNEIEVQIKLGKIGDGPAPTRMVSFPIGRAIAADIYI